MAAPDPEECREPADVGKLHHDGDQDIWYECFFDKRKGVYTWAIVPSTEGLAGLRRLIDPQRRAAE